MKYKWLIGGVIALLTHAAHAMISEKDVQELTLENGMKILVLEDHSIPNANMYIFWRAGSRNEAPGTTGLSHFFEHMMFNGSANFGPKMFDKVLEAAGGSNNAYTTENSTVYTNWFPADALELMFKLEADRIQYLDIDPDVVESERGVVQSERSTGLENSNFRAIWQEVKGAAFRAHPYSWPVIGHASDIANWSIEDLKAFHKTFYAPNNATVVIAGSVKFEEVKRLAKAYFGPIPAQAPPREVHTIEPEQKGERRVYAQKASVSTPNVLMAFHIPQTQHEDYYALEVLNDVLSNGNSSRLVNSMVYENQVASQVFTYMPMSIDPNLFYIYAVAAKDVSSSDVERNIISILNDIAKNGVEEQELQKVKNQKMVSFYRDMATINGKANTLGSYQFYFGDFGRLFDAPQKFERVTVEDVKRVASKYFRKANRTVGVLAADKDSSEDDL